MTLSLYGRHLFRSINPTASTGEGRLYTSRRTHEIRRPEHSIVYSNFTLISTSKYSPIKSQFFQLKKHRFIISNKIPERNQKETKKKEMGLFDLEKHFAFYGAYHSNPVNILIHMIFVWPIVFATLMLLYFTPAITDFPLFEFGDHRVLVFNFGFFLTMIYALYYVALDKKAGSLAALMCFFCWVTSSYLSYHLGFSLAWKVSVAAQLFCWTGQFLGHGVFEKRAPALLDNLSQALLMAPFFVLLEALQSFIGYEPNPGFHARVNAKIDAQIKEWQEKKDKKLS